MPERIKGKALVARNEGDNAGGVLIKLYGEETNGAIAIIEQPFEPSILLPPHVHENDVWLYVLEGEMGARVADEVVTATAGDWVLKPRRMASGSSTTGFRTSKRPTTCASSASRRRPAYWASWRTSS